MRDDPDARWRELHRGAGVTGPVAVWLRVSRAVARPLVRARVSPDVVTLAGLLLAVAAVPVAGLGDRWALAAAGVVVLAGLADGIDGAVAVMADRVTRTGALLDATCDRLADVALAAALWAAGAPAWLCAAAAGVHWLLEYVRARAQALGMDGAGVITVGERPTRVIVVAAFLLAAGLFPGLHREWSLIGAVALLVTGLVGLTQLALVARRRLTD